MLQRTLSDAARYLKMKLPTLTYQVQRLPRLGILEVTRTEARRGSPVKFYRAVSKHFFVPFQVTPQATLETLLHSSHHWFDERVKRAIAVAFFEATKDWGVDLYSDEPGDFNISLSPVLALRHADTKSLQCELDALFQRYNTLNAEGQHPYLVRLTLVPGTRR